jgi:ATP-dependent RNA helicase DHX36
MQPAALYSGGGGPEGAVLVFLPGWNEISQLRDQLAGDPRFGNDVLVLPLHSMVPPAAGLYILHPVDP